MRWRESTCLQTGSQRLVLGSLRFYRISSGKQDPRVNSSKRHHVFTLVLLLERFPHPAGAHWLQAFLCFVHVVLLLKVQVALELNKRLKTEQIWDVRVMMCAESDYVLTLIHFHFKTTLLNKTNLCPHSILAWLQTSASQFLLEKSHMIEVWRIREGDMTDDIHQEANMCVCVIFLKSFLFFPSRLKHIPGSAAFSRVSILGFWKRQVVWTLAKCTRFKMKTH